MARARDQNRNKAFEIYKQHEGNIPLKDIAALLGKGEGTVRVCGEIKIKGMKH